MIPKIIHYCWFGGNEKSEQIKKCLASWTKWCPDWEIKEWNENNFDVNVLSYTKEAYEQKKWAFVSDVVRLMVLYNFGGVYLDTDVEILNKNPFDDYLNFENVLVFENERSINSGLFFACIKKSKLCEKFLKCYANEHYAKEKEIVNSMMNKPVIVSMFPMLKWNAKTQILDNTCFVGTDDYNKTMKHYGTRSWCDDLPAYTISKDNLMKRILRNPKIFEWLEKTYVGRKIINKYEFLVYDLLDLGIMYYIKRIRMKMRK